MLKLTQFMVKGSQPTCYQLLNISQLLLLFMLYKKINDLKDIPTQVVTWLSHKQGWVIKRKFALTPMYEVNFSIFQQSIHQHEHVDTIVGYKVAKGNQCLHYSQAFYLALCFQPWNYMKMHRTIYHRTSIQTQPSLQAN